MVPLIPPNINTVDNNPPIINTKPNGENNNSINTLSKYCKIELNTAYGISKPIFDNDATAKPTFFLVNSVPLSPILTQL